MVISMMLRSSMPAFEKVYSNYYSFTRLWCVVILEIYLNFVVKISKKKTKNKKQKQKQKNKTKKQKTKQNKKKTKKTGNWLCLLFCTRYFDWAAHENKK